ncbi:ADP-ribosylation/Crystallin J1 [Carpediemonas membranifera]|uniref:ADP-ribosylhydrolase ARH3 n=1 Tax=Carpediemonas membranifera TaxID=201153 RepID=A0A8J6B7C6_9EUKA|nr:ADP-ribosylation/Crystallin J1 [Carpediemonas membranifera]|eukprot:KAG9395794.1 ADP-ribosylation/Crystallin J1 [Carpediemonas membranifera]
MGQHSNKPIDDTTERIERVSIKPTHTGPLSSTVDDAFVEKCQNILLAGSCGDALGKWTEFVPTLDAIESSWPGGLRGFDQVERRLHGAPPPYTDDTQMSLLVLHTLIKMRREQSDINLICTSLAEAFATTWLDDPQTPSRMPGNACLSASNLLRERLPARPDPAWWKAGAPGAGGCGAVMRAYPFALVYADQPEFAVRAAAEHGTITHGAALSSAATAAFVAGVLAGIHGKDCPAMVTAMVQAAETYDHETAAMIESAAAKGADPSITQSAVLGSDNSNPFPGQLRGWAGHEAIAAAAFLLARHGSDAEAAVVAGANTPGDSDSIASVAGVLSAAAGGVMPEKWRAVEGSGEIAQLVEEMISA